MILKSLNLTSEEITKRKTLLVSVPQFGQDAEIMVTEITVAGCVRENRLHAEIMKRKGLDNIRLTALMVCASLMSVMICPDTGDFLLKEDQLDSFHATVKRETLEALMSANGELNPAKPVESLKEKKSDS
jgi:hypothetical protein